MKKLIVSLVFLLLSLAHLHAAYLLLPMDLKQKEHLKAYGITYWILQNEVEAHWLLNYRGGSFFSS